MAKGCSKPKMAKSAPVAKPAKTAKSMKTVGGKAAYASSLKPQKGL